MDTQRVKIIFQNSLTLAKCYALFLLAGKADKNIEKPKSIIIVQRGQFGDMIVTTAMFRAVKKAYPQCRIGVVGGAANKEVLKGNPDVDEYIVWKDDVVEMARDIKSRSYDFGCITGPNFHSLAALYLAGITSIAAPYITNGWSPYETKPYKMILPLVIKKEHRMKQYVPREFLKLLEPIGIFTDNTKKYIYWTKSGEEEARRIIGQIPKPYDWLVGVMPGAGNKIKEWFPERFAQVADYLIEKHNARIILVGSDFSRKEADEMLSNVKNRDKVLDAKGTSVDVVKALVSSLDFTVSVDTGPVFIAEASGVPTVDIAGSIHPDEMAPNDGKLHLLVKSDGEPEIWTMNATVYNEKKAREQIESITVDKVIGVVEELIAKIKNERSH